MSYVSLFSRFSRLSVTPLHQNARTIAFYPPLMFKATPCLYGEPLKKKRRIDPAVVKMREERRKRKIEKQIKRLEKNARQLKPVDELEIPYVLIDERDKRIRPGVVLPAEEIEARQLLEKDWARYLVRERNSDARNIDRIVTSQKKALEALKAESEELYNAAVQVDETLLPYVGKGPVATPPIENYDSPDGEYTDVSRKWEN